jgi:hypothetical protein
MGGRVAVAVDGWQDGSVAVAMSSFSVSGSGWVTVDQWQ